VKYNIHNIWKGNAPPVESRVERSELKIGSGQIPVDSIGITRPEWRVQSIVQNVFPHLACPVLLSGGGNLPDQPAGVRRTKGVTRSSKLEACSFFNGSPLLNMRDGPRGRAPANSLAMANGLVTLNQQKSSVSLCVYSVLSAVKNKNTTERALHTRHNRAIYALYPTKAFRMHCIPKKSELAGGKANDGRVEYWKI